MLGNSRSTTYGKFTALREKRIRSTIISWSEAKRTQCMANAGIHLRLAALSRLHSECTCVTAGPGVGRVFAVEKHFFLHALLPLPAFVIFSARMPPFWYFFPLFFSVRSFYFARSTVLRKSFLKGGIYLFVHAALLPLLSFSSLYLEFLELVIFNNVYTKLC